MSSEAKTQYQKIQYQKPQDQKTRIVYAQHKSLSVLIAAYIYCRPYKNIKVIPVEKVEEVQPADIVAFINCYEEDIVIPDCVEDVYIYDCSRQFEDARYICTYNPSIIDSVIDYDGQFNMFRKPTMNVRYAMENILVPLEVRSDVKRSFDSIELMLKQSQSLEVIGAALLRQKEKMIQDIIDRGTIAKCRTNIGTADVILVETHMREVGRRLQELFIDTKKVDYAIIWRQDMITKMYRISVYGENVSAAFGSDSFSCADFPDRIT